MRKFIKTYYSHIAIVAMLVVAFIVMCLSTGCATKVNATTRKEIKPDGTIICDSNVRASARGDQASKLVGEGVYAEAGEEQPMAGIRKFEGEQKSSGTDAILAAVIGPLVNGLVNAYTFRTATATPQIEQGSGDYSFTGGTSGLTGTPTGATVAGFTATPGVGGIGVYGSPDCSRCRAYIANHGGEMIDYWTYRSTALAALKERAFSGGSVQFPLLITEDSYQMQAK